MGPPAELVARIARDPAAVLVAALPLIREIARSSASRFRLSAEEASDLRSEVHRKLIDDDYAALRAYAGRADFATYLLIVTKRLALDFRDRLAGKWRPSAEARRIGPHAVEWDRARTRDGLSADQSWQLLRPRFPEIPRATFEEIDLRLPDRERHRFEETATLDDRPTAEPAPDERLIERENRAAKRRVLEELRTAVATLPPEDRLLVALRFETGLKVSAIAREHGLDQKPLYRRLEGLRDAIARRLGERGVAPDQVRSALEALGGRDEDEP